MFPFCPAANRDGSTCSFADPAFVVYSSVASFYVPFIVTLLVYAQICLVLRRRGRRTAPPHRHGPHTQASADGRETHRQRKVIHLMNLKEIKIWIKSNARSLRSAGLGQVLEGVLRHLQKPSSARTTHITSMLLVLYFQALGPDMTELKKSVGWEMLKHLQETIQVQLLSKIKLWITRTGWKRSYRDNRNE